MEIPLEAICSLGVGGVLAVIVFVMYRKDRKTSEDKCREYADQLRQDRMFMEDRLTKIIDRDQESREKYTKVTEELTTLLRRMNGKGS